MSINILIFHKSTYISYEYKDQRRQTALGVGSINTKIFETLQRTRTAEHSNVIGELICVRLKEELYAITHANEPLTSKINIIRSRENIR